MQYDASNSFEAKQMTAEIDQLHIFSSQVVSGTIDSTCTGAEHAAKNRCLQGKSNPNLWICACFLEDQ
jgi:hypothetical protein